MKKELGTKYDIHIEKDKYEYWLKNDCFKAGKDLNKPTFTLVIPPPNVTGRLHLGHAWDNTLQDIVVRRKRMMGFDTLYLPGMDHAGIATQAKVDAKLKAEGTNRYILGREKFLEKAWEWKEEYAKTIKTQWAAFGLSVDYSKERFTLDSGLNDAVNEVFIELYKKGYIYQGERIINWDVEAKTALSNIEVEYVVTKGHLYHFKYVLEDQSGALVVATTRPETMFGDVAIMVNPKDERYHKYVGKHVFIPGTNQLIPVIEDDYVDINFGTGVVKVTPAHDPNDFQVGKKHGLDFIICMDESGHMNEKCFQYQNQERFVCRENLIHDLKKLDLLVKIEEHIHQVGHSERTHVVVEPRLSKQWFVKMDELAKNTLEKSEVEFFPKRFEKTFANWMTDTQDWCISRQLWWGHRIPAYYKDGEIVVSKTHPGDGYVQDEDVLDTWFSSALWPFSTLGFPDKENELYKRYFPTDLLVTGYDIIFFWVARMIFQSIEFTGKSPFKDVLIHGLIRDEQGRKVSKSLNNGKDVFDVIDRYGMDSLRYFLTTNSAPGQDLRYDEEKIESSWNFINKLWNISRFVLMNLEDFTYEDIQLTPLNLSQKYILEKLNKVIELADEFYEKYEFGEVSRYLYNFIWDEFASWYVEISKVDLKSDDPQTVKSTKSVLLYVLDCVLKLMHPFIPFVTEELHSGYSDSPIMLAAWPKVMEPYKDTENFETIKEIIICNRTIRNEMNKPLSQKLSMTLVFEDKNLAKMIQNHLGYIEKFCNPSFMNFSDKHSFEQKMVSKICANVSIYFPLEELVNKEEEMNRLKGELSKLEQEIMRCIKMLGNENFIKKASPEKVEEERQKLENYQKLSHLNQEKLKELME